MSTRRRGPALRLRMFGTPVRIGIGFPLTILAVPLLFLGPRGREPWFLGAWLVLVTVSVLVHEAGHVAALRSFGFRPNVSLNMLGGLTSTEGTGRLSPMKSIIVSLAGPAAGILLGFTVESALVPIGGRYVVWLRSASWMVNIGWSLVSLLPIMPLDGGHVMRELVTVASRRRGPAIAWLMTGIIAAVLGSWAVVGVDNGVWVSLIALVMVATQLPYFALTRRQRRQQTITVAHEQILDGALASGIGTLYPITQEPDAALVPTEAYTTLGWALLHERRYAELARLDPSRFNQHHRPLLVGATAWYRGDLLGAVDLVSEALADGRVEPPATYFDRVFGRLGERERLAHRVASLPGDRAAFAWHRLRSGLDAAGIAA